MAPEKSSFKVKLNLYGNNMSKKIKQILHFCKVFLKQLNLRLATKLAT